MSDLIERLRLAGNYDPLCREAADALTAQSREEEIKP